MLRKQKYAHYESHKISQNLFGLFSSTKVTICYSGMTPISALFDLAKSDTC